MFCIIIIIIIISHQSLSKTSAQQSVLQSNYKKLFQGRFQKITKSKIVSHYIRPPSPTSPLSFLKSQYSVALSWLLISHLFCCVTSSLSHFSLSITAPVSSPPPLLSLLIVANICSASHVTISSGWIIRKKIFENPILVTRKYLSQSKSKYEQVRVQVQSPSRVQV